MPPFYIVIWGFPIDGGTPIAGWLKEGKSIYKWMIWGVPAFQDPPLYFIGYSGIGNQEYDVLGVSEMGDAQFMAIYSWRSGLEHVPVEVFHKFWTW